MILWFFGQSGSGKTTTAWALKRCYESYRPVVILDGDEMRVSISSDLGFSEQSRFTHNERVARLAKILEAQGFLVLVCLITPYERARRLVKDLLTFKVRFIYLDCPPLVCVKRKGRWWKDMPFDEPTKRFKDLHILTDKLNTDQVTDEVHHFLTNEEK